MNKNIVANVDPDDQIDYSALGFKCGIEIHQQLDTKKLFCNCPSILRDDSPHFTVERRLRAVAGETGEIDIAARKEKEKGKKYVYEAYYDTTCLIELDEEPPLSINQEALFIALQVSNILKAEIVDQIQVMRKTVIDGSNTSGFQRTALIARNGILETEKGIVKIETICLEEESAKIISQDNEKTIYRLDRLGIPLVEIATDASIKDPEHCKEVAEKLGLILRSCKVKRGLGTIRQDVNVSIREGSRIEIKGCQDLRAIPKIVQNEVIRQKKLVDLSKELHDIKASVSEFHYESHELNEILKNSNSKLIRSILDNKEIHPVILGIKLRNFAGKLKQELNKENRLGKELAGRARVLAGVKGLLHSDELPSYGITQEEVNSVSEFLKCEKNDAFIIVSESREKAQPAVQAVIERLNEAFKGVPQEVRKAEEKSDNFTTSYLRPMPGSSRMYPETDIPLIRPEKNVTIPELITDIASKYQKLGVSQDTARVISKSNIREDFEQFVDSFPNVEPGFIAEVLTSKKKELQTRFGLNSEILDKSKVEAILGNLNESYISKEAVFEIMIELAKGKDIGVIDAYRRMNDSEIEKEIKNIISELRSRDSDISQKAVMGQVMSKLRGKADGKKIADIIKSFY